MKVFVAGATGVLGKRAVRQLVVARHQVTAVARGPEKAELLRSLGATPVQVDLFDPDAVKASVAGHDAVCNLATHIPPMWKAAWRGSWAENDRIRIEVSRNLVDAALAAGASRYVQESVAFMYQDRGDELIDEDTPVDVPPYASSTLDAEANAARFNEHGGIGVVLRFGGFYAPDSEQTIGFVKMARNHIAPTIGTAEGYFPMIQLDDAATAVVAALEAPAGVYNVVDEPTTRRDQMDALAAAVGVNRLRPPPAALAKVGSKAVAMLARSERVSNRRFKEATGWAPAYPTVREGWPAVVEAMGEAGSAMRGPLVRLGLAGLALVALQLGVWATVAPHSFYTSFPGGGRHWVAVDGPYNEHLMRDFGGLNLALALVTIAALVLGTRALVATAAGAWLVWSVPHIAYHAANLGVYGTSDQVANMFSLALSVVIPVLLLWAAYSTSRASSSRWRALSP